VHPVAARPGIGDQEALSHGYRDFMGIRISGQAWRGGRFSGLAGKTSAGNPATEPGQLSFE
jgi:hypothetical protein